MKLLSGKTYWDKTLNSEKKFPKLKESIVAEILIIGGGMSGNLAAHELCKRGHKVTLIEKNSIAKGSSSANTGLLQYSSDIMLWELAQNIGEKDAVLFYKMCLESMNKLTNLNHSLSSETDYISRDSIYYASDEKDAEKIIKEYSYLKKYDFPVEFLDRETLKKNYAIDKPCALRTWKDAEVNPYKFIRALVDENVKMGVSYFENTSIDLDNIIDNKAYTIDGLEIIYDSVILATGYGKIYNCIKDKARIDRTYAFSAVSSMDEPWRDKVMIWETKMPYIYFRVAEENRIIAGGLDEEIQKVQENETIIYQKTEQIKNEIQSLFPDLDLEIDYRWNALFGSSLDGLPFIGRDPFDFDKYYLLGYEGNGTCYSMAGADILSDLIEGKDNIYAHLLKVERKLKVEK
nr:FAD-dependent oxidoreductase [Tissierella sp.]